MSEEIAGAANTPVRPRILPLLPGDAADKKEQGPVSHLQGYPHSGSGDYGWKKGLFISPFL